MNILQPEHTSMALQVRQEPNVSATGLILQSESFARITEFAKIMAKGVVSIPNHLRGNEADCTAIVMQSMQWGMNPFSVATKTFISPGGQLSYEAQLVNAVINSVGPLEGRPEYEFIGEWERILGRVKEMVSDKPNGGKYYVKDWSPQDENGLGVICTYVIRGHQPRQIKVLLKQCWPRFSTQWATDPQQQICYAAIKKVARREFPDVILGVYTPDELESFNPEREINPDASNAAESISSAQPAYYPNDAFDKNFAKWKTAVESGKSTHEQWISTLENKFPLSDVQKKRIYEVKAPIPGEATEVQA